MFTFCPYLYKQKMKKLLPILFIAASFAGCKKCADCTSVTTTTLQYKSYTHLNIGKPTVTIVNSSNEVCGKEDIKNAEGITTSTGTGTGLSNYMDSYSEITVVEKTTCF